MCCGNGGCAERGGANVVKRKILVVDDDLLWHRLFQKVLAGYETHFASGCREGVVMAAQHQPDCILLDFHLGDGNAVLVCSELRKIPTLHNTPVVVISSDPMAECAAYMECGARHFLVKGSQVIQELPAIISGLLPESA